MKLLSLHDFYYAVHKTLPFLPPPANRSILGKELLEVTLKKEKHKMTVFPETSL